MSAMNDPGYRIMTVAERWPDHAGHAVRYSEHGRTDYAVLSVEVDLSDLSGVVSIASCERSALPVDVGITEHEYWCADCWVVLPEYWDAEVES